MTGCRSPVLRMGTDEGDGVSENTARLTLGKSEVGHVFSDIVKRSLFSDLKYPSCQISSHTSSSSTDISFFKCGLTKKVSVTANSARQPRVLCSQLRATTFSFADQYSILTL